MFSSRLLRDHHRIKSESRKSDSRQSLPILHIPVRRHLGAATTTSNRSLIAQNVLTIVDGVALDSSRLVGILRTIGVAKVHTSSFSGTSDADLTVSEHLNNNK